MNKFYLTFQGNDTFQTSRLIDSPDIMRATEMALSMVKDVGRDTIEQVRLSGVQEEQLARQCL